jgi:hypothetical protein
LRADLDRKRLTIPSIYRIKAVAVKSRPPLDT